MGSTRMPYLIEINRQTCYIIIKSIKGREIICKHVVKEYSVTHFNRFSRKSRELLRTCNTKRIAKQSVTSLE